jgi:hypothetical protein
MTNERGNKNRKQKYEALMAAIADLAADHETLNANDIFLSGEHGDIVTILQFIFGQLQQQSAQLITIQTTLDNFVNQGGIGPSGQRVNWNS